MNEDTDIHKLDQSIINGMRDLARQGSHASCIYIYMRGRLGPSMSWMAPILYMRAAFMLTLAEAKPASSLILDGEYTIKDEMKYNTFLGPPIDRHKAEWDM